MRRIMSDIGQWMGLAGGIGGGVFTAVHQETMVAIVTIAGAVAWGVATKFKYYGAKRNGNKRRITDNP